MRQLAQNPKTLTDLFKESLASSVGQGVGQLGTQLVGAGLGGLGSLIGRGLGIDETSQYAQGLLGSGLFDDKEAAQVAKLPPTVQNAIIKQRQKQKQEQMFAQSVSGILSGKQSNGMTSGNNDDQMPNVLNQFQKYIQEGGDPTKMLPFIELIQKERAFSSKERSQERKQEFENLKLSRKELQPVMTKIDDEATASEESFDKINEYTDLLRSGEAPGRLAGNLLSLEDAPVIGGLVGPITKMLFQTPTGEKLEKIRSTYVINAAKLFGSKISDRKMKAFLDTVPSLSQSMEGQLHVAEGIKLQNQLGIEKGRIANEIVRDQPGISKEAFKLELNARMKPIKKDLFKKWEKNIDETIKFSKSQSPKELKKNISPATSLAGAGIGTILGGALAGSQGGLWAGVPGAIGGGLLGALGGYLGSEAVQKGYDSYTEPIVQRTPDQQQRHTIAEALFNI